MGICTGLAHQTRQSRSPRGFGSNLPEDLPEIGSGGRKESSLLLTLGRPSVEDQAIRQGLTQTLDSVRGDVSATKVEGLKALQALNVHQTCVRNRRARQIQMAELRLLLQKGKPETIMILPSHDSVFPADRFSGEDKIMVGRIMGSERKGPTESRVLRTAKLIAVRCGLR